MFHMKRKQFLDTMFRTGKGLSNKTLKQDLDNPPESLKVLWRPEKNILNLFRTEDPVHFSTAADP